MKKLFFLFVISCFLPVYADADTIKCSPQDTDLGGIEHAVNSTQHIYEGPSSSYKKIINQKTSSIIGRVVFHTVDESTTVKAMCIHESYAYIKILTPSWLTHVEGWVGSSSLRGIKKDRNGNQIYEEGDFHWDSASMKYKNDVVDAMNFLIESKSCNKIDPFSLSRSSRGAPSSEIFYIVCDSRNLFFDVNEIKEWAGEYRKSK